MATKKVPVKQTTKKAAPAPAKKTSGTPLTAKLISQLKGVGITATTEEEANKKLNELFNKKGVENLEDVDLVDKIDMAAAFGDEESAEVEATEDDEQEEAGTEEEATDDETAEEETTEEPEEAAEEEEETTEDAEAEELAEEVKDKKLAIPKKKKAEVPAKVTKKATTGKAAKKGTRARKLQGKKWSDLSKAEKEKALKPFEKIFAANNLKAKELEQSITVKYQGKTSEQNIFKYHLLRLLDNGKLEGIFVSHRFKSQRDLQQFLPEDITGKKLLNGDSCAYIHPFSVDEVLEVLKDTDFLKDSIALATKQDIKMKNNRDKLQSQLDGKGDKKTTTTKKVVAATPKKAETKKAPAAPVKAKGKIAVKKSAPAKKVIIKKKKK